MIYRRDVENSARYQDLALEKKQSTRNAARLLTTEVYFNEKAHERTQGSSPEFVWGRSLEKRGDPDRRRDSKA